MNNNVVITPEVIARICHEANRAWSEILGDVSIPSWYTASPEIKNTLIECVRFYIANPGSSPKTLHDLWMKKRLEEGWKAGEKKDAEKKEHPCLVEYSQLPLRERMKDFIIKGVVEAFFAAKNYSTT